MNNILLTVLIFLFSINLFPKNESPETKKKHWELSLSYESELIGLNQPSLVVAVIDFDPINEFRKALINNASALKESRTANTADETVSAIREYLDKSIFEKISAYDIKIIKHKFFTKSYNLGGKAEPKTTLWVVSKPINFNGETFIWAVQFNFKEGELKKIQLTDSNRFLYNRLTDIYKDVTGKGDIASKQKS